MSRPQGAGSAAELSPTRLRQIALVSNDLDKAEKLLVSSGLLSKEHDTDIPQTYVIGTEVIFRDPAVSKWGLKNILGISSDHQNDETED